MNEFYIEQFVKQKYTKKDIAIPILILILACLTFIQYTILSIYISSFSLVMIVLSLFTAILSVIRIRSLDMEYEYLCTNGDLDFDKVIRKCKRKHLFSINGENIVMMAPVNAQELTQYRGVKIFDFSDKESGNIVYKVVAKQGESMIAILFSPKPEMVEKMWTKFPRNVIK